MMKFNTVRHCLLAAVVSTSVLGGKISAAPVTITDYSFENLGLGDNGSSGGSGNTGWSSAGLGGVGFINPQNDRFAGTTGVPGTLPAPAEGQQYAFIGLSNVGYFWQDVAVLQPNTIYTLTVAYGRTLLGTGGLGQIGLFNGVDPFGKQLAATQVDAASLTAGAFANGTVTFTTGQSVSGHLTVALQGFAGGQQMIFDNIRLDAIAAPQTPTALPPSVSPTNHVFVGTLVTLSEDPAGLAPFTYQWQTDQGTGGAFTDIPGATTANLEVNTTGFANGSSRQYKVVVRNGSGVSTSAPVSITAVEGAPTIVADTLPVTAGDVVGSSVSFTAAVDGTRPLSYQWRVDTGAGPVPITGATSPSLTLVNLQESDSGSYSLEASNAQGTLVTSARVLKVNPVAAAANGILANIAEQIGRGGLTAFTPTWTIAANSIIAGQVPSSVGTGNFSNDASGKVPILTDGRFGRLNPAGNGSTDFITAGANGGRSVTYTFTDASKGYDLSSIVVYGGWSDRGRDQQAYTASYATFDNPTTFIALRSVNYNPANPNASQSATRSTLVSETGGTLAKNVAAVKFDFTTPPVENAYAGYSEIGIYGVPSATVVGIPPTVAADTKPLAAAATVGSQVQFNALFTGSQPITYQWQVNNGTGLVNIPGATNLTLTLTNVQSGDAGDYSIVAVNSVGTASSTPRTLTVNQPEVAGVFHSELDGQGFVASNNDLLQTSLAGYSIVGSLNKDGCAGISSLTNGAFGEVGGGQLGSAASGDTGTSITFKLNTTGAASGGYNISRIETFAGWDGYRGGQSYVVSYSVVTDPETFIDLATVFNDYTGGANNNTFVRLVDPTGGSTLAINVAALRFTFSDLPSLGPIVGAGNRFGCYREIDVFGQPIAAQVPIAARPSTPSVAPYYTGVPITLTEVASGTGTLRYQWQTDNGNGGASFTDIPGATNTTYAVKSAGIGNVTVQYQVVVRDSVASTVSLPLSLTFTEAAPDFVMDPILIGANATVGSKISLTSQVSGSYPMSFQWQVDNNSGSGLVNVPGGTNATLILDPVQLTDAGIYNLTIANALGTLTSSYITVNVAPPTTPGVLHTEQDHSPYFVATNDLLQTSVTNVIGVGNFTQEGSIGLAALTNGIHGGLGNAGAINGEDASAGGGESVIYQFDGGKTITRIETYSGWGDYARGSQRYDVAYSTTDAPASFIPLFTDVLNDYQPEGGIPNTFVRLVNPSGQPLASKVAALRFIFKGVSTWGWSGYREIDVFGTGQAPRPTLSIENAGANLRVTWSRGTLLQADALAGPWTTNSAASPYLLPATGSQKFYRVVTP